MDREFREFREELGRTLEFAKKFGWLWFEVSQRVLIMIGTLCSLVDGELTNFGRIRWNSSLSNDEIQVFGL